jgi:HEAT repeat protein
VRFAAAHCLAWSRNWRYAPTLLRRFNDPNETPRVRGQLAEALAYLGAKRAIPDLVRALGDDSGEVRFWATFALGSIADESVIPALEKLTRDRTMVKGWWTVGKEARDAIRWIRNRHAENS